MKQFARHLAVLALLAVLLLGKGETSQGLHNAPWKVEPLDIQHAPGVNLLENSNMEQGFYWKYPNHYVANEWHRWWVGEDIPEYDDVRAWRPERYDGNHAQIYFRWGRSYTAGIYQRVAVRPCTYYQFSMYGRNHSVGDKVNHHAKIGIDPLGREYGLYMPSLPSDIVWSPEQTFYYTWGQHTVVAESYSDYITAIAYVSPDNVYTTYDTFWDAGALIELPPSPGQLSAPPDWDSSDFITSVVSRTQPGQLIIEWDTVEPASAQIWYQVRSPAPVITSPITPTGTLLFPYVYLPMVVNLRTSDPLLYPMYTPLDRSSLTHHQVTIDDLTNRQIVEFVILARHPENGACRTLSSGIRQATVVIKPIAPPPQASAIDVEREY